MVVCFSFVIYTVDMESTTLFDKVIYLCNHWQKNFSYLNNRIRTIRQIDRIVGNNYSVVHIQMILICSELKAEFVRISVYLTSEKCMNKLKYKLNKILPFAQRHVYNCPHHKSLMPVDHLMFPEEETILSQ